MKKIRELIDQVGKPSHVQSSHSKVSNEDVSIHAPKYKYKDEVTYYLRNPQADREAIENIDPIYFDADASIIMHELERLPETFSLRDVEGRQKKLRHQLNAVSKKLSDVILENQPSYTKELKDVQELQRSLHNAFVICSNGRRFLMSVSVRSTTVGLALLSNQQQRQKLSLLFESLQTIKTLQHTDVRLREMLEEEDYDGAIQLCLECLQAASTYKHYHCIKDLSSKLQDTLELIEEQIDVALSNTCKFFDEVLYTKLQLAYQLLGKTQSATDQLLMHYTTGIHNTAFQIVLGYAELASSSNNFQKKQYRDLCGHVDIDMYIPCLMDLCKALWRIMKCYHMTSNWHEHEFPKKCHAVEDEMVDYVNRKLAHGRHRVWADVQSRIRSYILSSDLSRFKYDDFIAVLDIVKRFISVGEDFCCGAANSLTEAQQVTDNLNEPLRKQTLSYFQAHHATRLEELLMFLENEAWQPCPVRSSFTVLGMQEFKFLKRSEEFLAYAADDNEKETASDRPGSKYFDPFPASEHPFVDLERSNLSSQKSTTRQMRYDSYDASDDDDVNDELHQEYVDERTGESPVIRSSSSTSSNLSTPGGPIMTNTALHVLRLCGNYMKMCDVLKPIAMDVVVCMSQLFDLYFYSVYNFFSTEQERLRYKHERLAPIVQHIEESLFIPLQHQSQVVVSEEEFSGQQVSGKIRRPCLSPMVILDCHETYYGITERIVATESLVCLAEQYQSLQKHLEQMVPQTKKAFLRQFYSQTVFSSPDVRWPALAGVASHSVNFTDNVERMSAVNWDVKDIMSQHNLYVDQLLSDLESFKATLYQSVRSILIPDAVIRVIWGHCIIISNHIFVEGFSNVKKCSNEGRALMQLDYQQFLTKLEKLTNIRPIPNREFVEAYIKAYYMTESDLENWMHAHSEYSSKQLSALVNCSAATYSGSSANTSNRKTKQKMMSLIEELTSRKQGH